MNPKPKHVKSRFKYNSKLINSYQSYNKFRKFRDFLNYIRLKKQNQRRRQKIKFNFNSALNNRFKFKLNPTKAKTRPIGNTRFKLVNGIGNVNGHTSTRPRKALKATTTANVMPDCQFFVEGRCNSESCPYRHINVGTDAKVCPHFSRGYCPDGDQCKHKHLFVVRKKVKTKMKCRPKSQNCVKQSIAKSLKTYSQCQSDNQCLSDHSLPHFIPISQTDTDSDHNRQHSSEPTLIEQTSVQTISNSNNRNNRKDKYFWLESDDEISLDSEDMARHSSDGRPSIAIVPKFFHQ